MGKTSFLIPNSWLTRHKDRAIIQKESSIVVLGVAGRDGGERARGGMTVSEVRIRENESLESALKRFKRQCARTGVLAEARKREHYEKPSVKRKKKAEAARKRKY